MFAERDDCQLHPRAGPSGSDDVLADMRRQHAVSEYLEVVETFDDQLDYWTLSTDFIVGFPTEEQADHEQAWRSSEKRPEKVNVTRFSKRPGTDAADMKGLGGTVKKERSKEMSEAKMEQSPRRTRRWSATRLRCCSRWRDCSGGTNDPTVRSSLPTLQERLALDSATRLTWRSRAVTPETRPSASRRSGDSGLTAPHIIGRGLLVAIAK